MRKNIENKSKETSKYDRRNNIQSLVFAVLFAVSVFLPHGFAAADPKQECAIEVDDTCGQKTELPREWKWKKPDISFDHMYRN